VPIISSGSVPTVLLLVAWWTDLGAAPAVAAASLVVVVRLASLGLAVGRLSGRPPTRRQLLAGLVVAVLGGVVVGLKVWLTH
jgi:VIT1/CCC1 family predicted Fe2+/Mn2+ transporter